VRSQPLLLPDRPATRTKGPPAATIHGPTDSPSEYVWPRRDDDRLAGEPLTSPATASAAAPVPGRSGRIWTRALLAAATLLAVLAIFAVWADRQLLEPRNWADTSSRLLQRQTIRDAVSAYLVDQLYVRVDVPGELESGLPAKLRPLGGPIAGALHSVAEDAASRLLESARVQDAWRTANYTAAATLKRIVDGGGATVSITRGTVYLDLRRIVTELARRLGVGADLAGRLPPSAARIRILTSEDLGLFRNLAKALHALALALCILVAGIYALAVLQARGRRRRTLMSAGAGLALAGVAVLVARKVAGAQLVPSITKDASIEAAAGDAYSVATSLLVEVAGATIAIGAPLIAAGWFAGPSGWAVAGRRFWAAPLRARPALGYWLTAALLGALFIWSPIAATSNPLAMILITIVAFAGAHTLTRQIAREFPDVEAISARAAISRYAHSISERAGRAGAALLAVPAKDPPSLAGELERLDALRRSGAIDELEFREAKREILGDGRTG